MRGGGGHHNLTTPRAHFTACGSLLSAYFHQTHARAASLVHELLGEQGTGVNRVVHDLHDLRLGHIGTGNDDQTAGVDPLQLVAVEEVGRDVGLADIGDTGAIGVAVEESQGSELGADHFIVSIGTEAEGLVVQIPSGFFGEVSNNVPTNRPTSGAHPLS